MSNRPESSGSMPFDFHARRNFLKNAGLGCGSLALTSLLKDQGLLSSANAAESVYVAVNGVAIYHADPAIAQAGSWTEWQIPLSEFADKGVNLAAVNAISIGLGDKNNIAAGGTGVLYVDDIRLYRP